MAKRLTVIPWECHQTGDCCRAVSGVVMTKEEAETLGQVVSRDKWLALSWKPGPPSTVGTFVELVANPCPLLTDDGKCSVHSVRPYNCRRFACLRPDPANEPFEPDHDRFGCGNARVRVDTDRGARRFLELLQRKAMKWALSHGWRCD